MTDQLKFYIKLGIGVLGIVAWLGTGVASYLQGRADGYDKRIATEHSADEARLKAFDKKLNAMLAQAAAGAFADFNRRAATLDRVATQLEHDQEIANENANRLANAMRGRFVIHPAERLLYECIRRPRDPRCAGSPDSAVRNPLHN